jgi:FMN phosphatase YigB (HAD superfamily)
MMMTAEQVLDGAPNATVLTVDFFDTLITRSVAQPTHIFAVMEQRLIAEFGSEWKGFAVRRVQVEADARAVAANDNPLRDITIDEIYLMFAQAHGLSMSERTMLIERETATELEHVLPVQFGREITEAARLRGMRVVIVSDNYMSASHLVNMAHAAGYAWVTASDVFVSCEHSGMKHNGELWHEMLHATGISAESILHVGDDRLADEQMPTTFGIATHVRENMRRSHRHMVNTSPAVLPLSRIEAVYRDNYANSDWSVAEVLGGGAIALLVASQIVDVMNVLQTRSVGSIHFVARDGYLAHAVWKKLRAAGMNLPEASYTALSRSVIWRSGLEAVDEETAQRFVGDDEELTVERLSRRVGCDLQSHAPHSHLLSAAEARRLLIANSSRILDACAELRQRLFAYLQSVGMTTQGHHLLVDLGWTGSTIADVASILSTETNGQATVEGRLLGMYWDAIPHRSRVPLHGFAVNEFHGADANVRLLGCQSLFESLVTAPHGSVIGYTKDALPEFVDTECEQTAYRKVGELIAKAAISAAFEIMMGIHRSGVVAADITADVAWATMMQLGHTPRPDEVTLMSSVAHVTSIDHEGAGERLIEPMPSQFVMHSELPEIYDSLMHLRWVQGTLAQWSTDAALRWIPDEIRKMSPMFQPQWVQIP